jgi:IclR family acetate operon transcriptional repressor
LATRAAQREEQSGGDRQDDGRYTIAVLVKAFDLLDAIADMREPTLTELSDATGQSRPTTLRILSNLVARGYADRDRDGRYRLGVKLLQLGGRAAAGIDLRTIARPVLDELHGELQETINLAIPSEQSIVYIDILESARDLRMAASVGMRDAFHSSALGKAILSRYPESMVASAVGPEPLTQKTGKTLQTLAALTTELQFVRKRGYAVDDEENEPGGALPRGARHGSTRRLRRRDQCLRALDPDHSRSPAGSHGARAGGVRGDLTPSRVLGWH